MLSDRDVDESPCVKAKPPLANIHRALRQRSLLHRGQKILVPSQQVLQRYQCSENHVFQFCDPNGASCIPYACEYAHNHPMLAVTDEGQRVTLLRTDKGNSLDHETYHKTFYAHTNTVLCASWSNDDTMLATGSADHLMRLWDVETQQLLATCQEHTSSVGSVYWHPMNRHLLVTASKDGSFRIWDTRFRQIRGDSEPSDTPIYAPIKCVKEAHEEPAAARIKRRKQSKVVGQPDRSVTCALFLTHEEDKIVSSGSVDGTIKVWDCRAGRDATPVMRSVYGGPSGRPRGITDMKIDNSGTRLFSLCLDQSVYMHYLIDLSQPAQRYTDPSFRVGSYYDKLAISPDDRFILTGSSTSAAFVWEVDWPQMGAVQFTGHDAEVTSVSWCKYDMMQFASCSDDYSVRLWSMRI